jgi:hypothetical protein
MKNLDLVSVILNNMIDIYNSNEMLMNQYNNEYDLNLADNCEMNEFYNHNYSWWLNEN